MMPVYKDSSISYRGYEIVQVQFRFQIWLEDTRMDLDGDDVLTIEDAYNLIDCLERIYE